MTASGTNGLHTRTIGSGPRLVLAHGFTQNGDCWGELPERLASQFEVVLVDLPGHGRSGHDEADLWQAARLLGQVGGPATYVGYSMGGRTALHLALQSPALIQGLVLIGVTAGIEGAEERMARIEADHALADRLGELGLDNFLDEWLAKPLFAGLDDVSAARQARLTNRVEGLQQSLRYCGTGTQEPLWPRLAEIAAAALVIAGEEDKKFTELGQRLAAELPAAEFTTVPGSHAVHLQAPTQVAELISTTTEAWRVA